MSKLKKAVLILAGGIAVLILIQFVPYGKHLTNPPVSGEPAWDSPQTKALFFRVCKNCHSNQTEWPWYSAYAPASWLIWSDVAEGRSKFNVSEWGRTGPNRGDEAHEELEGGDMPPFYYLPAHPEAKLTDEEKAALISGLKATFNKP